MSSEFTYQDLDVDLLRNAFTGDFSVRNDLQAIRQSVTNLLLTRPKERFFSLSTAGVGLQNLFFEIKDNQFASMVFLKENTREVINRYEPRVIFQDMVIHNNISDDNGIEVEIIYDVVAYGGDVDSLTTSNITDGVTITIEGPSNG